MANSETKNTSSSEDDLFDNGIDGEPWGNQNEAWADQYSEEEMEYGANYIYDNPENDTQVIYFSGQWNDSGVDPDRICIKCDCSGFTDKGYSVYIDRDKVWITVPGKNFSLNLQLQPEDFIDIESPVPLRLPYTDIAQLKDALSEKKVKIAFDKEKFKEKLERYRNLLVFS